jgi:hypothetical protein
MNKPIRVTGPCVVTPRSPFSRFARPTTHGVRGDTNVMGHVRRRHTKKNAAPQHIRSGAGWASAHLVPTHPSASSATYMRKLLDHITGTSSSHVCGWTRRRMCGHCVYTSPTGIGPYVVAPRSSPVSRFGQLITCRCVRGNWHTATALRLVFAPPRRAHSRRARCRAVVRVVNVEFERRYMKGISPNKLKSTTTEVSEEVPIEEVMLVAARSSG